MRCSRSLSGAFLGLLNNRILKSRLASVGMFSFSKVNNYGITGVIARGAGLQRDLRLRHSEFYGTYWYFSFRSFTGKRGDNLDRFIIRIKEVLESFRIISQALSVIISFIENNKSTTHAINTKNFTRENRENFDNHFDDNDLTRSNEYNELNVFQKHHTQQKFQ